jgi:hypothetical protein
MFQITERGTLWTLTKNGKTARADVRKIEGVGVELRYYWDAELMQSFLFKDGTELLKEAQIKRFDLEERGWLVAGSAQERDAGP